MHAIDDIPKLPQLGIEFPDFLVDEILSYQQTSRYDDVDQGGVAGAGISLHYGETRFLKVDVYEYDQTFTDLGTGIESKVAFAEFLDAQASLIHAVHQGLYSFANILGQALVTIPGEIDIDWLQAFYIVGEAEHEAGLRDMENTSPGPVETYYYAFIGLTVWKGQFIKVRVTQICDSSETESQLFAEILTLVSTLLRGDTTREAIHAALAHAEVERKAVFEESFQRRRAEDDARVSSEVAAGTRCPKCGMAFGWDGTRCSRCDKTR